MGDRTFVARDFSGPGSFRTRKELKHMDDNQDDRFFVNDQFTHNGSIEWDCCILIEDNEMTAYQNSRITVTLIFPAEYPYKPPAVFFQTPVFHPYVREETGELCSCILRHNWSYLKDVSYILGQLHAMIISDGSNYDDRRICINRQIQELRNNNYMLFFSVIQHCFGFQLPEDDTENITYANRGSWHQCVQQQQHLRFVQDKIVTVLFQGQFNGMEHIVRRFLGFAKKEELLSEYTLPSVEQPTGTTTITTSNGDKVVIPQWSSIKLLDQLDVTSEIQIPFTTERLSSIIALCKTEQMITLRCVSPTNEYSGDKVSQLTAPFQTYSKEETFEILKTADFLGVERIVISACLYLSHLIRRESRVDQAVATPSDNTTKATFQTFVSDLV